LTSLLQQVAYANLALFIDRQDNGVRRRIDIKADHVTQLGDEFGVQRAITRTAPVGPIICGPSAR
jgi:hypothetical protein